MEEGRASRTAMMVAYMRALADVGASHVPDFRDPTARVFLNAKWSKRLADIERQVRTGEKNAAFAFAQVTADNMALRTAAIDAAVRGAIARGTRQVVILGAGLDGRAWRMPELAGVRVFEVDHPATQAFKRKHLDALPPTQAIVSFVPVNFERDALDPALDRAGHDASLPTCWIWEGVVMYLTRETMLATLAQISARSAKDSTLIINYHTTMRTATVRLLLRLLGEPVRSASSIEQMAADLRAAGFQVVEDTGMADWAKRFAVGEVNMSASKSMRIVEARRV